MRRSRAALFAEHNAKMSSSVKRRKIAEDAPPKVVSKSKKVAKPEPVEEKSSSPEPVETKAAPEKADTPAEEAAPKSFKDLVRFQSILLEYKY